MQESSFILILDCSPIAILCNFSLIFEHLIFNTFQNLFDSQNVLSKRQFGFRKNRSTELVVFDLLLKACQLLRIK